MPLRCDPSTPVLLLRVHHGTLGVARSLGRLGVQVYGVTTDRDTPAVRSRYFRGLFDWSFVQSTPQATVEFLLGLGRKIGGRPILIPSSDDLVELVADHAEVFREVFRFQDNPADLVRGFSNKKDLFYLARKTGVPTPDTEFPLSRADVQAFLERATFPVMLKGIDGMRLQRRSGRKMLIVRTAEELLARYDELEDPASPNLMLQEYIPGGDDTIWMLDGYFDAKSDCVFAVTGKKLRQYPVHVGATSLGICLANPQVRELTERFIKGVGYRGILDVGFRYDARDGQYKLLDPNPRIGSTFRLFVSEDGMDVARYLYLDLTGQPLPPEGRVREGRKWVIEDQDLESCMDYRREGTLSVREWVGSYRGVAEAAWFAGDDLAPFRLMAGRIIRRALGVRGPRPLASPVPAVAPPVTGETRA